MTERGVAELESVLGYRFGDPGRLGRALMHSSRVLERTPEDPVGDNQRLEFLGDAVLGLVVSEELVRAFPLWSEGQLSKSRAHLVNGNALCAAARRLDLGDFLRLGRGEEKTGGRSKPALLADTYEAIVAAIYLDGGMEAARSFVLRSLVEGTVQAQAERLVRSDYKSALQEHLQSAGIAPGNYQVVGEAGPDHEKTFEVEVHISGGITGVGVGRNKKDAEQLAALAALKQLGAA